MDDIMALTEEALQKAYVEAVGKFTSCPYYGTEVLPEGPIELYKKGYAKHITIMAGSTADEARLFMGEGPAFSFEEQKTFARRAVGAAHSVELIFVFNLRGIGTGSAFNGTNVPDEIFTDVMQMWTNFARCGNPSTDRIEWKAYSADDQNVLDIAGPGDIRIKQGLLADQYKAVLPLLGYYQFMDKYFTPGYMQNIIAARENS